MPPKAARGGARSRASARGTANPGTARAPPTPLEESAPAAEPGTAPDAVIPKQEHSEAIAAAGINPDAAAETQATPSGAGSYVVPCI